MPTLKVQEGVNRELEGESGKMWEQISAQLFGVDLSYLFSIETPWIGSRECWERKSTNLLDLWGKRDSFPGEYNHTEQMAIHREQEKQTSAWRLTRNMGIAEYQVSIIELNLCSFKDETNSL